LLNKIDAASVLELRIGEMTNQFLMHSLEQLLLQNKRARDAEAELMDAQVFQWRLRQQRFVAESLRTLNAKQAAIAAGYSPRNAQ